MSEEQVTSIYDSSDRGKKRLSLEEAILLSLEQNPTVKIGYTDVTENEGLLDSASGEFDLTTFSDITYSRQRLPVVTASGSFPSNTEKSYQYSLGLYRKLRNGILLSPQAALVSTDDESSSVGSFGQSQLSMDVIIPLLRGFGNATAGALENAQGAELMASMALYQHILNDQALVVLTAYWRLTAAEQRVNILKDVEVRALELVKLVNGLVVSEIVERGTLSQVRANYNQQRAAYLAAEAELASAKYAFGFALGLDVEKLLMPPLSATAFPDQTAFQVPDQEKGLQYVRHALNMRRDYVALLFIEEATEILLTAAKRDLLPKADLTLSGGYNGADRGEEPFDPLRNNLTGLNFTTSISMEWPWQNRVLRGELRQRRSANEAAQLNSFQLSQSIASDVLTALEKTL